MNKRILLIHNPISGGARNNFPEIFKEFESSYPNVNIISTTHVGHARELAKQYKDQYDIIGAVGGDGTINEIASVLVHSDTRLGIIPIGSANGLAFHLGIPQDPKEALKLLNEGSAKSIDVISAGNYVFVNVAGIGFDGHINRLFNQTKQRGLWSYAKLIFTEYIKFKPFNFLLTLDGSKHSGKAFFIVLANSTQYGHNFHVAPNALTDDGILHIMLIKKPPFIMVPWLIRQIFKGNILKSRYCQELSGQKIQINVNSQAAHFDGETTPELLTGELAIEVMPKALKVIY